MDSTTAVLQRQGPSGKQLGCFSAVALSDSTGSTSRNIASTSEALYGLCLEWSPLATIWCIRVCEVRQSLIHLLSKVKPLRLQTTQKLLYCPCAVLWVSFGLGVLKFAGRMELNRQMFLMSNNATKTVPINHFHGTVFKVWAQLRVQRKEHYGLNETVF